jgi:hypothetical protein
MLLESLNSEPGVRDYHEVVQCLLSSLLISFWD